MPTPLQLISDPRLPQNIQLYIKRDDLIHPKISGNKWRKLKYNIQEAKAQNKDTLLTFGGAYSNHIHATAAAGKHFNFKTIGIIRGEEHLPLNPTLSYATTCGMELHYMSRSEYRNKKDAAVLAAISERFNHPYLLPEGGTNALAVKGCTEVIDEIDLDFDYICTAVGTGGTMSGLVAGLEGKAHVLGFSALKGGGFLKDDVADLVLDYNGKSYNNYEIVTDYHFGGYAKKKPHLMEFMADFKVRHGIALEWIYTGKMMYGIFDLAQQGFFKENSVIVALHTGGLQVMES